MKTFYGFCCDTATTLYEGNICESFRLSGERNGNDNVVIIVPKNARVYEDIVNGNNLCVIGQMNDKGAMIANIIEEWGRICTHCGKHITEGYYLENLGTYACSEECAIAQYDNNEQAFRDSIWLDDEGELADDSPTFWTEWE